MQQASGLNPNLKHLKLIITLIVFMYMCLHIHCVKLSSKWNTSNCKLMY